MECFNLTSLCNVAYSASTHKKVTHLLGSLPTLHKQRVPHKLCSFPLPGWPCKLRKALNLSCFGQPPWQRVAVETAAGNRCWKCRRKSLQKLHGDLTWRSFVCQTKRMIITIIVSSLLVDFFANPVRYPLFSFCSVQTLYVGLRSAIVDAFNESFTGCTV